MPIYEIQTYIKRFIKTSNSQQLIKKNEINDFLEKIKEMYGYDYLNYSEEIVSRMIEKSMRNNKISSFKDFKSFILENNENFKKLFFNLSINFTEFFRDSEIFKYINNQIFDYVKASPNIKIWCAGCSTGEEAYSIAILLEEYNLLKKSQIYATDINPLIIEQAKNGLFSKNRIKENINNYINAGGTKDFKDYFIDFKNCYQIKDDIREKIVFFEHSLLSQGIINEFDIILCRNVLIYFNKELFKNTINLLYKSLKNNGFLVLGKNEDLITNNNFYSL
jgi:chemotaxis protein methyltransferase CheR